MIPSENRLVSFSWAAVHLHRNENVKRRQERWIKYVQVSKLSQASMSFSIVVIHLLLHFPLNWLIAPRCWRTFHCQILATASLCDIELMRQDQFLTAQSFILLHKSITFLFLNLSIVSWLWVLFYLIITHLNYSALNHFVIFFAFSFNYFSTGITLLR